ncbi:hypothetical protein ID866_12810 [Astraeus odoratus]|nr:hypothetical protein ID866_12810 [Astraeus odoratus]
MAEQPDETGHQQQLVATTEKVINRCPRLRVLVIGKVVLDFRTLTRYFPDDLHTDIYAQQEKDNQRGNAEIDKEIVSPSNNRFVLHDSNGFEAGDKGKYQTVTGFITARNNCQDVRDKLHAIW